MEKTTTRQSSLIQRDHQYIWHPFTQMMTALDPIPIARGEGIYLYAEDGTKYLDGISSWWVNLHGHCHPYIVKKIQEQAELLEHVLFAGFTHRGAIDLAEKLLELIPGKLEKVFYSDNGSTAVETALKIAIQYWYNKNPKTEKKTMISFKGGYHGDTFGAMSVAGKNDFNHPFWDHLFEVKSIDPPLQGQQEQSLEQMKDILQKGDIVCFIFEPLILCAGGMLIYPPEGLDALIRLCHDHSVITIADEVATGFGRTGPLFASEMLKEKPDMICLSKGITGGFLPLAVTACKKQLFDSFLSNDLSHALLHGHTYSANPLSCAAALANLDLLADKRCSEEREEIAESHKLFCLQWRDHPRLKRCESLGTILVLEYFSDKTSSYYHALGQELYRFFLDAKIILRPLGNIIYVMPPYCINQEELQLIYNAIIHTLKEVL